MSSVENLAFCDRLQDNLKLREFYGLRYALGTRFRQCENLSSVFDELVRVVDGDEAVELIKDLVILCGYGRLLKNGACLLPDSFSRIFHGSATFEEHEIRGMKERAVIVQVISRLIDNPKNWEKFRNYMYAFADIPKKADRQLEDMFDELREFDEQKQLGVARLKEILVKLNFCELEDIVNRYQRENEVECTSTMQRETNGILQSVQKRTDKSKDEDLHKDESVTDDDCFIHEQQENPPAAPSANQSVIQSYNTVHGIQTNIVMPGGTAGNVTFNAPLVTIPVPVPLPPTTTGGMTAPDGKSPARQSPTRAKSPNIQRNLSQPEEETDKTIHKLFAE